jgi:hypothetical protein
MQFNKMFAQEQARLNALNENNVVLDSLLCDTAANIFHHREDLLEPSPHLVRTNQRWWVVKSSHLEPSIWRENLHQGFCIVGSRCLDRIEHFRCLLCNI